VIIRDLSNVESFGTSTESVSHPHGGRSREALLAQPILPALL